MIEKELIMKIEKTVHKHLEKMKHISDFIFKNPELGNEEFIACEYLSQIAEDTGFIVTRNYCDLDTSFLAEMINGEGPGSLTVE